MVVLITVVSQSDITKGCCTAFVWSRSQEPAHKPTQPARPIDDLRQICTAKIARLQSLDALAHQRVSRHIRSPRSIVLRR